MTWSARSGSYIRSTESLHNTRPAAFEQFTGSFAIGYLQQNLQMGGSPHSASLRLRPVFVWAEPLAALNVGDQGFSFALRQLQVPSAGSARELASRRLGGENASLAPA